MCCCSGCFSGSNGLASGAHGASWLGIGTSVGKEIFTDLDFADDVALLAEMLSVLVLALEVMNEEAKPLGLTITGQRPRSRLLTLLYSLAH